MTAIFAYAGPEAAYVLADGAWVGYSSGRLHAVRTKIVDAAADKTAALAISGPEDIGIQLFDRASFAPFDDVVDRLENEVIALEMAMRFGYFSIRLGGWLASRSRADVYNINGSWLGAAANRRSNIDHLASEHRRR